MITGTIKTQIDQIWNAFWSGGVSNPLSVIEQLTFLMFIKRLDDLQMGWTASLRHQCAMMEVH
ncbi:MULTISPECIES: type I restriction-modification system subunit M N-terminal domain-containing protein [Acetobacteraceae]|uniref:Type I restriction-modification system M subunit n=1 Tax=Komagataeibacter medellinensis (strain NBRC 3288 / BCRC 11682 / LMG 1693 / Kondo 51) TaxID=634177 RepID=G2I7N0_KOMMN|nr:MULTISPECIES: type I restriction-modification system subunit M N-terminal domain-containing protein [Acetobacteraceae]BAK84127.1 type I restriction-modification system M subunit [Komagataeibacter medellinensis NBRC 3288]